MAQARPSFWRDLGWRLEAVAYDAVAGLARLFPVDAVSDFGAWLFAKLGPLTGAHRVAETNLRIAFPDAPEPEIRRLLQAQWRETGRGFAEFPILDRIVADPGRVEIEHFERLTRIAAERKPVVLISGHFSNFEVMAWAIVQAGITCRVTYRAANNPHVDARIVEGRRRYGVSLFAPKGTEGARELMRALARGEAVALLNDQKFNGGVAAPLFGRTAHTAPGPSIFALRFGAPIQPLSVQRTHKARFKVIVHEPIVLADTGDRDADVEAAVRRINAFMEARVRERPAEWFWVHKRWPNEVYKPAAP
jgi:KDO2-lipid IV(A) lauroyltransferase